MPLAGGVTRAAGIPSGPGRRCRRISIDPSVATPRCRSARDILAVKRQLNYNTADDGRGVRLPPATAQLILYAITGVAAAVWVIGLQFLVGSVRRPRPTAPERFDWSEPASSPQVVGVAEVEGEAGRLAAQACSLLARGDVPGLGQVRIVEKTENRVVFAGPGEGGAGPAASSGIVQGRLEFAAASPSRSRVDYAVELRGGRGLLLAGAIVQAVGLLAIVAGFWLIQTYVVNNAHPAIRAQSVQMLQVVHFLWPPFLCGGLYRARSKVVRVALETFLQNLPYRDD